MYYNFKTSASLSVSANTSNDAYINIEKAGYKPIALAGWSIDGTGSSFCIQNTVSLDAYNDIPTTCHLRFRNTSASSNASTTVTVNVLYRKVA